MALTQVHIYKFRAAGRTTLTCCTCAGNCEKKYMTQHALYHANQGHRGTVVMGYRGHSRANSATTSEVVIALNDRTQRHEVVHG